MITAFLTLALFTFPQSVGLAHGRIAHVTDGDTIRLTTGERIRIAGIDSAETNPRQAKCRAEVATGNRQKAEATRLLKGRQISFRRVGRSYDRTIATLQLDGRDLAALLVERRIAAWWPRGKPRPVWCPVRP